MTNVGTTTKSLSRAIEFQGDRAVINAVIPGHIGGKLASLAEDRGVMVLDLLIEGIALVLGGAGEAGDRLSVSEWLDLRDEVASTVAGADKSPVLDRAITKQIAEELMRGGFINAKGAK